MDKFVEKERYGFDDLVAIMARLRAPDGCPWDRVQTHESIRQNMIEEAYEAADAIDSGDSAALCEELGDVLFQAVFHAELSAEDGGFDIGDVVDGICKKLVFRHTHVFGDVKAADAESAYDNWEKRKREEKSQKTLGDALDAIPRAFPALLRAEKSAKKANKAGKLACRDELLDEIEGYAALARDGEDADLGRMLLAAASIAALDGTDAEGELDRATSAFISDIKDE